MGQAYGVRPSSLLDLDGGSWAAYQFDGATLMLGRWVEAKLEETDKQGKRIHRIQDLLKPYSEAKPATKQYASMAGLVTRKVKIKPDGTWDE